MKKPKNIEPREDYESQSLAQLNIQRKRMNGREFRDALTRANGAVVGVKTNATQWNRWSV